MTSHLSKTQQRQQSQYRVRRESLDILQHLLVLPQQVQEQHLQPRHTEKDHRAKSKLFQ